MCQHSRLTFDLRPGLVALVGPNARGKSNAFRALVYALTGSVDGNWGSQSDLQKDGEATPGFSLVVLFDGKVYLRVKRYAAGGVKYGDVLEESSDGKEYKPIAKGRAQVNRTLSGYLGLPVNLLFLTVWSRQGEMEWLLKSPATVVNSFLSALFDMKIFEKFREALKLGLGSVATLRSDSQALLDQLEASSKGLPEAVASAKQDLDKAFSVQDEAEAALKGFQDAHEGLEEALQDRQKALSDLDNACRDLEDCRAFCEALRKKTSNSPPDPGSTPFDGNMEDLAKRRKGILSDIETLNLQLSKVKSDQLKEQFNRSNTVDWLKKFDDCVKASDATTICEACGGPIVDKETYKAKRLALAFGEAPAPSLYNLQEKKLASIDQDLDDCQKWLNYAQGYIDFYNDELQKVDKLFTEINKYNSMVAAKAAWVLDKNKLAESEASLKTLTDRCATLRAACDQESPEAVELLKLRASAEAAALECEKLGQVYLDLQKRQIAYTERSSALKKEADDYASNKRVRDTMSCLRSCLGGDKAQALFIKSRIEHINAYIDSYTEKANLPFHLWLDVDQHIFLYRTQDGAVHPAGHLSGAQKSLASVILQIAVNSCVEPNLSLFLMDEPETACDDNNVRLMAQLFASLNAKVSNSNGNVLMITRQPVLIEECKYILELS